MRDFSQAGCPSSRPTNGITALKEQFGCTCAQKQLLNNCNANHDPVIIEICRKWSC